MLLFTVSLDPVQSLRKCPIIDVTVTEQELNQLGLSLVPKVMEVYLGKNVIKANVALTR